MKTMNNIDKSLRDFSLLDQFMSLNLSSDNHFLLCKTDYTFLILQFKAVAWKKIPYNVIFEDN